MDIDALMGRPQKHAPVLWAVTLASVISACSGSDSSNNNTSDPTGIGSEGGTVADANSSAQVSIPAGALDVETAIEVATTDAAAIEAPPMGQMLAGDAVAFTPHGTQFSAPVTILLPYNASMTEGLSVIRLADEADDNWETVPGAAFDNGVATVQVNSFSILAVAASASSVDAGVGATDGGVGNADAGSTSVDGGVANADGGETAIDAGSTTGLDGSVENPDAGVGGTDGGGVATDSGSISIDTGVLPVDAGVVADGGTGVIGPDGSVGETDGGVVGADGGGASPDGSVIFIDGGVSVPLVMTGVIDGPLAGGLPKAVELYVTEDVSDLSICGIGSANNGGGTDGEEFTFSGSATAGDFIYVTSDLTGFDSWFAFAANFDGGAAMGINGDDAVELFCNGIVVDVFGDINVDGTGEAWEHLDGWAYRNNGTGPDGSTFQLGSWTFSGICALDGETFNATADIPFPTGTYLP